MTYNLTTHSHSAGREPPPGSPCLAWLAEAVNEVIRILGLPAGLEEQLDPYVREKYRDLWQAAQCGAMECDFLKL